MKSDVPRILLKNRILFLVSFMLIMSGFSAGIISYSTLKQQVPMLLDEAFSGIFCDSVLWTIFNVIMRNLWASAILVLLGITLILSGLVLFVNGFVIGLVVRFALAKGMGVQKILLGILPHGIFEIPALLIASAVGMRVGMSLLNPGPEGRVKSVAKSIREASLIYFLLVVPLLVVAAVVEVFVSSNLIQM